MAEPSVRPRCAKRSSQRGSRQVVTKRQATNIWKSAPTRLSDKLLQSKRRGKVHPRDIQNARSCRGSDVYETGDTIVVDTGEIKKGGKEDAQRLENVDANLIWTLNRPPVTLRQESAESGMPGAFMGQSTVFPRQDSTPKVTDVSDGSAPITTGVHRALGTEHARTSNIRQLLTGHDIHVYYGRSYIDDDYWVPNDEKQQNQLDIAHHLYLLVLEQRLYLAPIGKNPRKVLDIGTGTGIWAMDFAVQHASATVIGCDISPVYKEQDISTVGFEVKDVRDSDWGYEQSSFDFIHARGMSGCVSKWPDFYRQVFDSLAAGGWYEQVEISVCPISDDGSVTKDSILGRWGESLLEAGDSCGKDFRIDGQAKGGLEAAGFEHVVERTYKLPIGPWSKDCQLQEIGNWNRVRWTEGIEGWSLVLLGGVLNWRYADVQAYLKEVRKSLTDPTVHAYQFMNVVYGRKPEQSVQQG